MNRVQPVVIVELVGGLYDGSQCALSADEHGFPPVLSLLMPVPPDPLDSVPAETAEAPPVLRYECLDLPDQPSTDPWLFRLVP